MANDVNVNTIYQGKAYGDVATTLLANGMNANALRPWVGDDGRSFVNNDGKAVPTANAATLRKDEWKQFDDAIVKVAQSRMVGVKDLKSRGLILDIENGLGTTVLETEIMSDISDAELNMDGDVEAKGDRPMYDIGYLPLPIISKPFQISTRVLEASRKRGQPLDTANAEMCVRKIVEKMESILFTGSDSYAFGGGTLYGYMDAPNSNSVNLVDDWDDSSCSGTEVLTDVLAMKQSLIDAKMYGPYVMYIPTNYETALDDEFKTNSDVSIRERLMKISGISEIIVADSLTANNVLLVQMSSDVVRMVSGLPITMLQWESSGGMRLNYNIITIDVPQVRSDYEGNSGICHLA